MVVRYRLSALAPDALRAGLGFVFAIAPMLFMNLATVAMIVLGALGLLFGLFAIQIFSPLANPFWL